jgi:hypothetical protein
MQTRCPSVMQGMALQCKGSTVLVSIIIHVILWSIDVSRLQSCHRQNCHHQRRPAKAAAAALPAVAVDAAPPAPANSNCSQ